jgi:FtsP/CotA-like multicopper oxidase with cupredoxin domain
MGMMGFFVVHPKDPAFRRVDRDFVFLMNSHSVDPGNYVPKAEITNFNMWTWSRVLPGIDPMVAAKGDKVRIRMANLSMTNHPIHLHGVEFVVSCTDGGWLPEQAACAPVMGSVAIVVGLAAAAANWGVPPPGWNNATMRLAYIHNIGDVYVSLAPVLAGVVVAVSGYSFFDPLIAGGIALWIIGAGEDHLWTLGPR